MLTRTTRVLAVLLVTLLLLALGGCGENPGAAKATERLTEKTDTEPVGTEQSETEPPEPLPILPLDRSQMEDPAARVIDRAPSEGREGLTISGIAKAPPEGMSINYMTSYGTLTLYPNASPLHTHSSIEFSFQRWNLETFRLLADPFRSAYQLEIREWTPEAAPQLDPAAQPDAFPYFLYASWRGMDWKELARLELAARENPDDGDAARARDAFRDQYLEDFLALQPEDLPSLPYLYEVAFSFPPEAEGGLVVDETVAGLDCTVDDFNLGGCSFGGYSISLRAEDPRPAESPGLTLLQPGYEALAAPLNNGDCRAKAMKFTVGEDLTLHGIKLYKSKIQVKGITVLRARNGENQEQDWDGVSDLPVRVGETVEILLTLHDPEAENFGMVIRPDGVDYGDKPENAKSEDTVIYSNATLGAYCRDQFCVLDYSLGEQAHTAVSELILRREAKPWELILLIACDGDHQFSKHLYSYYLDYYNPLFNPAWQGRMPSLEVTP